MSISGTTPRRPRWLSACCDREVWRSGHRQAAARGQRLARDAGGAEPVQATAAGSSAGLVERSRLKSIGMAITAITTINTEAS